MSALRLARPIRPLAAIVRSFHSTPACLTAHTQAPNQMPYGEQNTKHVGEKAHHKQGADKETLAEVADKAKKLTNDAVKKTKPTTGSVNGDLPKRAFHASAFTLAPRKPDTPMQDLKDSARVAKEQLKDSARDLKSTAKASARDVKSSAKSTARDLKDTAKDVKDAAADKLSDAWAATKSAAKSAKDTIVDVAQAGVPPSARLGALNVTNERHEPTTNAGSGRASAAFNAADLSSASDPVRQAARAETLSTTTGRRGSTLADDDTSAARSAGSVGLKQESVKKSLFDGPAEMPQGVGKRAHDADGKPMETGTRNS